MSLSLTTFLAGLMDMVLDPDFSTNNWLYVFYCRDGTNGPDGAQDKRCRVSRFTHNGNKASLNSEKVIFVDTTGKLALMMCRYA